MGIKVLGIAGSPRRDGNSAYLLAQALEAAEEARRGGVETELYSIAGKRFGGCLSCFKCAANGGECVIRRDDFEDLRRRWDRADVIVYSVPVYHMCIPGQLRCFIDRLGNVTCCRHNFQMPKQLKVVGAIAQGCHLFSGQENTIMQLVNHALMMGCVPVSGDLPECYIGAAGWTAHDIAGNALRTRADARDAEAEMAVRGSRSLGRRAVEVALLLRAGADANRSWLSEDHAYRPLLDRAAEAERETHG